MITVNFTNEIENITSTDHLYQWDVGVILQINGLVVGTPKVHFTTRGMKTALVVQSSLIDGSINAPIPDKILQEGKDIVAYVYVEVGASKTTVKTIRIPVIQRVKPNDYEETNMDNFVETQSYLEAILKDIENIKYNGLVVGVIEPETDTYFWFDTSGTSGIDSQGMFFNLVDDETEVKAEIEEQEYGVENATLNKTPTNNTYDFTIV